MRLQGAECVHVADTDGLSWKPSAGMNAPSERYDGTITVTGASFTTAAFPVMRARGWCAVVSWPSTGTPVGTMKVQASVNREANYPDKPDTALTEWVDLPFVDMTSGLYVTSFAISGSGSQGLADPDCYYRWIRFVYTRTSGNIVPKIEVQYKGVG